MTEAERLACEDASIVLEGMAGRVSARKVRLALCGCLRTPEVWSLLPAPASRRAVETGEAFADGNANLQQLGQARKQANTTARRAWQESDPCTPAAYLATYVCRQNHNLRPYLHLLRGYLKQLRPQTGPLRDIFGNPFRPVTLDPSWLTSTVLALAEGIYVERAFDRMPILADALQDAGCENPEILDHCRGPGPHVRGCFVVDLLTGRK